MPTHLKLRALSRPILTLLETTLEKTGQNHIAQRLRQAQHKSFGLSGYEWILLRAYFEAYEQLGVTVRKQVTTSKAAYLNDRRMEELAAGNGKGSGGDGSREEMELCRVARADLA
ncbi:hypothetical protein BJY04DRAFT_219154 [Aspergillus karnatakaensis]|uniref:uncharacterized protein n=1 Tax=Aspergillus karnatakaensis TaxID=1810916 RepID=UPI003CCC992C